MGSEHLSIRVDEDMLQRLDALGQRERRSRSEMARTLLEEGLRMERHPGIVFRPGPAGRRPGLACGPDVWEVARVLRGVAEEGEEAIRLTAELTGQHPANVRVVAGYYAEYRDEIDEWMRRLDEEADRAEATWLRTQESLQR